MWGTQSTYLLKSQPSDGTQVYVYVNLILNALVTDASCQVREGRR